MRVEIKANNTLIQIARGAFLAVSLGAAAFGGDLTIARREAPPEFMLVIPQPTTEPVKYAREELRTYVELITGVRLVGCTDAQPLPEKAILLGNTRFTKELLGEDFDVSSLGTDGFRIVVKGERVLVLGSGPWERGGGIGATKEVRLDCVEISRVAP